MMRLSRCIALALALSASQHISAAALECTNWQQQHAEWLWCDDFEADAALEQNYFDVNRADGRMRIAPDVAVGGTSSLKSTYGPVSQDSGSIKLSFGKTPVSPKRYTTENFDDVYWRFYMRTSSNWSGNPYKVTRATIFSASNWSQAAIGHLWEDGQTSMGLGLEPVSGVSGSTVTTTKYNDFDHFTWLGKMNGVTPVYDAANRGKWNCIEVHMKLNTPGQSDGVFEFWLNDRVEARRANLNWRGGYTTYGINAIMLEAYRNEPFSQTQDRYIDNFVVSRQRVGCLSTVRPNPPTNVAAN